MLLITYCLHSICSLDFNALNCSTHYVINSSISCLYILLTLILVTHHRRFHYSRCVMDLFCSAVHSLTLHMHIRLYYCCHRGGCRVPYGCYLLLYVVQFLLLQAMQSLFVGTCHAVAIYYMVIIYC